MMNSIKLLSTRILFSGRKNPLIILRGRRNFSLSNEKIENIISVNAHYIAGSIDLQRVDISGVGRKIYGLARRQYDQRSVIITTDPIKNQHVALFNYGSIVFFNTPEDEQQRYIKDLKETKVLSDGSYNLTENYKIVINPNLEKPSIVKAEYLNIQSLDFNNITIIGTVMAQSVAIDLFALKVDKMFETLMKINKNSGVKAIITQMFSNETPQLFSSTNIISYNLLSKMGILEVTDAAWENADYTTTWHELRRDFEIDYRYRDLISKLELIKENSEFFLEVDQHYKFIFFDSVIIFLISFNIYLIFRRKHLEKQRQIEDQEQQQEQEEDNDGNNNVTQLEAIDQLIAPTQQQ